MGPNVQTDFQMSKFCSLGDTELERVFRGHLDYISWAEIPTCHEAAVQNVQDVQLDYELNELHSVYLMARSGQ